MCVHVPGRGGVLIHCPSDRRQRHRARAGNWEGLHASSTSQACVQPHLGGFEVVSGLVSTLQDPSLLFRNKVKKKIQEKKRGTRIQRKKGKGFLSSFGFLKI